VKSAPDVRYCRNGARHWFTYYGQVGTSAPRCRRCNEPNPRYRPADDPYRRAAS
jgi:hypothetical protein